jgi:hypothetical protein
MATTHIVGEFIPSHHHLDDNSNQFISVHIKSLENKMAKLETQIQKAVMSLGKKETYVNAIAVDLEHIITLLVNRVGNEKKVRIEPTF